VGDNGGSSPHVRGTDLPADEPAGESGSSPHVRGTGSVSAACSIVIRFIPARAGNRTIVESAPIALSVHPRTCGEQPSSESIPIPILGSSPHVRGTAVSSGPLPWWWRFIPARAGNRAVSGRLHKRGTVHPRTCGEQEISPGPFRKPIGSSPHVRGTVLSCSTAIAFMRFIPARAGNRNPSFWRGSILPVHPRTCGEQAFPVPGAATRVGSSPHVRGTDLL